MPDDKVKDFDVFVKQFAQAQQRADENLRADAYSRTPLLMQQGNCVRCHDKGPGSRDLNLNLKSLDFAPIKGYDDALFAPPKDKMLEEAGKVLKQLPQKISFDLKPDGLKNIKGLSMLGMPIEELTVTKNGDKTVVKAEANVFGKKMTSEVDPQTLGISADQLTKIMAQMGDLQKQLQVKSISRDGDNFSIVREQASKVDFGGTSVLLGKEMNFKLKADSTGLAVSDVRGVTVSMPLPDKLGLGSSYMTNIKGIKLDAADRGGSRSLTVDADNMIDQVSTRLGADFKPVTDSDGSWRLQLRGNNPLSPDGRKDRMAIDLRIGQDGNVKMKPSEVLDIVSRMSNQASDLSVTGVSLGYTAVVSRVSSWFASWFE